MIIGSISENRDLEKRISITPEIAKKYINLGFKINLSENYGKHLGIEEKEYTEHGVNFIRDDKKLIETSDIIIQMSLIDDNKASLLKSNQILIGVLNPYENKNKLEDLAKKGVNLFSLELLPRITRAQSMDILSSQANLAGSLFMNSSQNDIFATLYTSSSVASSLAYFMLFIIVSSNNVVSWLTREIFFLKEEIEMSYIDWLSINISPETLS